MRTATEGTGHTGALVLALVFLGLIHGAMIFLSDAPLSERPLGGADAYSRLIQVGELESGGWHQDVVPRSNAPYGEPRVWSRIFDVVLWLGARALAPFLGFQAGLHVWGVLVAPVLHLATLAALFWAAAPLLRDEARLYLGLLFPFQVSITAQFLAGRPDHHPLLALLFVLVLGAGVRLLAGAGNRFAAVAGVGLALALWVSVEALILAAVLLVGLALAWYGRRLRAEVLAVLALSTTITLVPALMLERETGDWLAVEFDRVSVVHLLPFSLFALFWLALWIAERRGQIAAAAASRLLWLMIGALFVLGLQLVAFPKFFLGPMADVPPEVRWLNVARTSEYGPVIDTESLRRTVHLLLLYLGGAVIAAVALPLEIARSQGRARDAWAFLALAGAVYLGLALYQIRWGLYAELVALPVLAATLARLAAAIAPWRLVAGMGVRASFKFTALLVVAVAPIAAGWWLRPQGAEAEAATRRERCDVAAIARFLMQAPPFSERPYRIVNFPYDGPELLYRTHHQVVATPNHRNGAGLLAARDFFAARKPEVARRIAEARGLELALICPSDREGSYYRPAGETAIWDRLRAGRPPEWLHRVTLPSELATGFLLYQVVE